MKLFKQRLLTLTCVRPTYTREHALNTHLHKNKVECQFWAVNGVRSTEGYILFVWATWRIIDQVELIFFTVVERNANVLVRRRVVRPTMRADSNLELCGEPLLSKLVARRPEASIKGWKEKATNTFELEIHGDEVHQDTIHFDRRS